MKIFDKINIVNATDDILYISAGNHDYVGPEHSCNFLIHKKKIKNDDLDLNPNDTLSLDTKINLTKDSIEAGLVKQVTFTGVNRKSFDNDVKKSLR